MLAWRLVSLLRCFTWKKMSLICKNIFTFLAFLFSAHNIKGLSRRKRICFERYLSRCSLIKNTCSWHDKLILFTNACYLSCVYLPWMWFSCLLWNVLNISNMFFLMSWSCWGEYIHKMMLYLAFCSFFRENIFFSK